MPSAGRQLELLPMRQQTAAQRKESIRERLSGLQYRQAARAERRRLLNERRRARRAGPLKDPNPGQMTIEQAIARADSADLHQAVATLPLFPDIDD